MNPYLIPALTLSPRVFERLVSMLDPAALDEPTHPGRFSPREIIAHLADWEPILLGRMRQTVNEQGSELKVYDEGEMAIAHNYATSDIQEQMRLFADLRKETVAYLSGLSASDWGKEARHPERGMLTVQDQANMLPGHDMYHLEQLSSVITV